MLVPRTQLLDRADGARGRVLLVLVRLAGRAGLADDALAEVDVLVAAGRGALRGREDGRRAVARLGGRGGAQLHGLVEDAGQLEGARGHPVLARAALGGLGGAGEAVVGGGGRTVEALVARPRVKQRRRVRELEPVPGGGLGGHRHRHRDGGW